jgi:hypothetical protein
MMETHLEARPMFKAQASRERVEKSENFRIFCSPNQPLYSFLCTNTANLKCIIHAKTITHVKGDKRAKKS